MKYLLPLLLLTGCSEYPKAYSGIVHDYIIDRAKKMCGEKELHFIVSEKIVLGKDSDNMKDTYPCRNYFSVQCQDGTKYKFSDDIGYCFISISQMKEATK